MKLIDNVLFLEFGEMVECGVSESYLKKAKSSGIRCWHFTQDPNDKRKVLVGYEDLKDQYKKMVIDRFGNPYDMVARQPILQMVINDHKANEYFKQYRYNENNYLPIRTVTKYTRAASWLNMLAEVQTDRAVIKKVLGLSVPDFYEHAKFLMGIEKQNGGSETYQGINQLPGDFPSSYQRIMAKVNLYKEKGYDFLINPMYGNKMASKIGNKQGGFDPELYNQQMAVIRAVAAKHNNFDASQVARIANTLFDKNGWNTVSRATVYNIMQENKAILTPGRRGRRSYNSEIAMQVKRVAPKHPLFYFTLDGWTAELLYQDKTGYSNRLVMVVVLDACGKYPVGYAIGDRENAELIRQANRNAVKHIKDLFGDFYQPRQLQSDHYALKQLTPFYMAMSHLYTPAAVGNAKSKIIEPYFKDLNKNYCQFMPNWSGHNINASKKNQVNSEMLDLIKKDFPDRQGVIRQLDGIIEMERRKKINDYMASWEAMPEQDRLVMSRMDYLMVFGEPIGKTNLITGQGIIKRMGGVDVTYDCFDPAFREHLYTDWQIVADREDISSVLAVSEDGKLKFVLDRKLEIPMDVHSTTDEHREALKRIKDFNQDRTQEIIDRYASDTEIVQDIVHNTPLVLDDPEEAALKLMFTRRGQQKEGIQDAKRLKQIATTEKTEANGVITDWQRQQMQFLQGKTNFDQFLD